MHVLDRAKIGSYIRAHRAKTLTTESEENSSTIALRGWPNLVQIKSNMAAGRHLEKIDMTS